MSSSAISTTDYRKFREGNCSSLDANGNPTPDIAASSVSEGTWFISLAGPDPVDNGTGVVTTFAGVGMWFRSEGGVWVWRDGTFRASNSNGGYVRDANGWQRCWSLLTGTAQLRTWTFPAPFPVAPVVQGTAQADTQGIVVGTNPVSATSSACDLLRTDGSSGYGFAIGMSADGRWSS